jgi:uncharacterized RDD family membrane protein YckC
MNEIVDPYRAPEAAVQEVREATQLPTASRRRRLGTFVLDWIGQQVMLFIVIVPVVVVMPELADDIENMGSLAEMLMGIVGMLVYYVAFESLFGRTPGKFVCGTRVVDERGLHPTFGQVVGRTFARLVPFEAFSILFATDDDVRGWHDRWPRTRVVRVR